VFTTLFFSWLVSPVFCFSGIFIFAVFVYTHGCRSDGKEQSSSSPQEDRRGRGAMVRESSAEF
jgi:hypothetical protein